MRSLFLPVIMCFWRLWIMGIKGLEVGLDVGLGLISNLVYAEWQI
jgi:hypothetical protein